LRGLKVKDYKGETTRLIVPKPFAGARAAGINARAFFFGEETQVVWVFALFHV